MSKKKYFVMRIKAHTSKREAIDCFKTMEEAVAYIYAASEVGYTYFVERR